MWAETLRFFYRRSGVSDGTHAGTPQYAALPTCRLSAPAMPSGATFVPCGFRRSPRPFRMAIGKRLLYSRVSIAMQKPERTFPRAGFNFFSTARKAERPAAKRTGKTIRGRVLTRRRSQTHRPRRRATARTLTAFSFFSNRHIGRRICGAICFRKIHLPLGCAIVAHFAVNGIRKRKH